MNNAPDNNEVHYCPTASYSRKMIDAVRPHAFLDWIFGGNGTRNSLLLLALPLLSPSPPQIPP